MLGLTQHDFKRAREDVIQSKGIKISKIKDQIILCKKLGKLIKYPEDLQTQAKNLHGITNEIRSKLHACNLKEENRLYTVLTNIVAILEIVYTYAGDKIKKKEELEAGYINQKIKDLNSWLEIENALIWNAFPHG